MRGIVGLILVVFLLYGCTPKCGEDIDTSDVKVDLIIKRADVAGLEVKTKDDLNSWLNQHDKLHKFYTQAFADLKPEMRAENEAKFRQGLFYTLTNEEIQKLVKETQRQFSDFEVIESDFSEAFARFKYYDPTFEAPEINTFVSGFGGFDCNLNGDLLIIGLEYFLNDKSEYFDFNIPTYALQHYKKENIVPKSIQLLQDRINAFDPLDRSLLSHMIYYGKALYFARQILPCTEERVILEYTEQEMQEINAAQEIIYAHFVSNKLFYSEGQELTARYINLRPTVSEIGPKCPGRIGRWLGYQIVKKYMEDNPDVSLMDLMKDKDSKKIFAKAHYKPSNNQ